MCQDSDGSVLGTTGACMVEREVRMVSTLSQAYSLEKMPHQIIRSMELLYLVKNSFAFVF